MWRPDTPCTRGKPRGRRIEDASGDVPPPPSFLEVPFENWMDHLRPDLNPIQTRFDLKSAPKSDQHLCFGGSRGVPEGFLGRLGEVLGHQAENCRPTSENPAPLGADFGSLLRCLGGQVGVIFGSFLVSFSEQFCNRFWDRFGILLEANLGPQPASKSHA